MTLETQYKLFLEKNPTSTFTFEEWKTWFGEGLSKSLNDEKHCMKHDKTYTLLNPCQKCLEEKNN